MVDTDVEWQWAERLRVDHGPDLETERIPVRVVLTADAQPLPLRRPDSCVSVIGDSNIYWYVEQNADFGRALTHELGRAVDVLPALGGGATLSREELARATSDPDYLESRCMVVWVFSTHVLLTREWRITPVPPWPPSRMSVAAARDRRRVVVVSEGVGHRTSDTWYAVDEAGFSWMRGRAGEMVFETWGAARRRTLLIDARAYKAAEVSVHLNGVWLGTIQLRSRPTEVSLMIPPATLVDGENRLDFDAGPLPIGARHSLGIRSIVLLSHRVRD